MVDCRHIALGIFFATGCFFATAQVQEELSPSEQKKQTIVTQPLTIQKGFLNASINTTYQVLNQSFDDDGNKLYDAGDDRIFAPGSILKVRYTTPLSIRYGLTDRLQIGVSLPYIIYRERTSFKSTQSDTIGRTTSYLQGYGSNRTTIGDGWGDLVASVQFQVLRESGGSLGLVFGVNAKIPTGRKNPANVVDAYNYTKPVGDGEFVLSPHIIVRKVSYPFSFTFQANYFHSFGGKRKFEPFQSYLWVDPAFPTREYYYQSPDRYEVKSAVYFHLNDWIVLGNGASYARQQSNSTVLLIYWKEIDVPVSWKLNYEFLLSFQIRRFRLNQYVFFPLAGKNSAADPSFALSIGYTF